MFPRGFATPQCYDWNHGRIAKSADDTEMEEGGKQLAKPDHECGGGVGGDYVRQYGEMDRTHFSSSSLRQQDRGTAGNSLPQDHHGRGRETRRDHQNLSSGQSGGRGGHKWGGRESQGDHTEQMSFSPHGDRTQHDFDDQWAHQEVPFVAGESWRVPPDADFGHGERERGSFPSRQEKNRGTKRGGGDDRDQNVCEGNAKTARVESEFWDEPYEESYVNRNYTEESSSDAIYRGGGNEQRERTGDQWNRNNRSPTHSQRDEQRRSQNRDRHWVHQTGGVQKMTEDRTETGHEYDQIILQEMMERSIRDDPLSIINQTDGRQVRQKAFQNRGEQRRQAGQNSSQQRDQQRRTRQDTEHMHSERDQRRRDWRTGEADTDRRGPPRTELGQTAERGGSRNPGQQGLEQLRPSLERPKEEDEMSDMSLCSDEGQGGLFQTTDKLNEDVHHQLKYALNSGISVQQHEKDITNCIHEMTKLSPTQFRKFITNNAQHLATLTKFQTDHEQKQEHVIGQQEERQRHEVREQGHKQEHGIREPVLKQDSYSKAESLGKNPPLTRNHPPYPRSIEEDPQQRAKPMNEQAPSRNPLQPSRSEVTLQYAPVPVDLAYGRDSFYEAQALRHHAPFEPGPSFEPAIVILPPMVYPPFGDGPSFGPQVLADPSQHPKDPSKVPLLQTPQYKYAPPSPVNTDVGSAETRSLEPAFVLLPSVDYPPLIGEGPSFGPQVLAAPPQHPKDPSNIPLLQTPHYRYVPPPMQTANVGSVEKRHLELDTAEKRGLETAAACVPSAVSLHKLEENQQKLQDWLTLAKEAETRQPQPTRPSAKPTSHDRHQPQDVQQHKSSFSKDDHGRSWSTTKSQKGQKNQNSDRPEGRSSSTRQRSKSPSRQKSRSPFRQKSESPVSSEPARKRPRRESADAAAAKKEKSSSNRTSAKRSREHSPSERTDDSTSAEKLTHASTTEAEKKTLREVEEQMMIRAKRLLQLQQELNRLVREKEEWLKGHRGQAGDTAPTLTPAMIDNTTRQLEIGLQMKALKEGKTMASVLETETASMKFPSDEKKKRDESREVNCCKRCDLVFYNTHDFVSHLASVGHLQNQRPSNHLWQKEAMKKYHKKDLYPSKGAELLVATVALYCPLCCELCPDTKLAKAHLRSQQHYDKYQDYLFEHPSYERHYQEDCRARQNQARKRNPAPPSTRDYYRRRRSGSSSASSYRARDRRTLRKRSASPDDVIDLTEMSPTHSDDKGPRSRPQPASNNTVTASQSASHAAMRSQPVSNFASTSRSTSNRGTVSQLPDSRVVVCSDPGLDFDAQLSPVSADSLVYESDDEPDVANTMSKTAAAASKPSTASEPVSPPSTPTPASNAAKSTPAGAVDTATGTGRAAKPKAASATAASATAAAKPTSGSAAAKPTPAKPTPARAPAKPTTSPAAKPTPASAGAKPTSASATAKPTSASAPAKPTSASAPAKPTPASAAAKPTPASAPAKPTTTSTTAKPTPASAPAKKLPASMTSKETPASATPAPAKPTPARAPAKPTPASAPAKPVTASAAAKQAPASATAKKTPVSATASPKRTLLSAAAKTTPTNATSKQAPVSAAVKPTSASATSKVTSTSATSASAKTASPSRRSDGTILAGASEKPLHGGASAASASASIKSTPASADVKSTTCASATPASAAGTKQIPMSATAAPKNSSAKPAPENAAEKPVPASAATKQTPASATAKQPPTSAAAKQPPTSAAAKQPPTSAAAKQPPTSATAKQPPTSAAAKQPPTSAAAKQPPTSATAKQPLTSATAAPASVKPALANASGKPAAAKQTPASTSAIHTSPATKSKLASEPEVSAKSAKPVATTGVSKSPATTPTRKTPASKTCKSVPTRTPKAAAAAAATATATAASSKTGSRQMVTTALPREAASAAVSQQDTMPQSRSEITASDASSLSDSTALSNTALAAQSAALEGQNPETLNVSSTPEPPPPPPASTSPTKRQTRSVARQQGGKKEVAGSSSASGSV